MMINGISVLGEKSFGSNFVHIDEISQMNIFIGKNNIGKTTLLSLIEKYIKDETPNIYIHINNDEIKEKYNGIIEGKLLAHALIYNPSSYYQDSNHLVYFDSNKKSPLYTLRELDKYRRHPYIIEEFLKFVFHSLKKQNKIEVYKVGAERNIVSESPLDKKNRMVDLLIHQYKPDGTNFTKILHHISHNELFLKDNTIDKIIRGMNTILGKEAKYKQLKVVNQNNDKSGENQLSHWEIYLLDENINSWVKLSECGSGLKTILQTLFILHSTDTRKNEVIRFLFFEELENNLHPIIQRNLFSYLYSHLESDKNLYMFISTHSHVPINMFTNNEKISIYHVFKEGKYSNIKKANKHLQKAEILNDLGMLMSDLLQSNGIIWVEGPSDIIYIRKWIEILDRENILQENIHYQFMMYGGRLLNHFGILEWNGDDKDIKDFINILTINRNAFIVIDSDKKTKQSRINSTKKRIEEEFHSLGMGVWITSGKEIENNVNNDIWKTYFKTDNMLGKYDSFNEYVKVVRKVKNINKIKIAQEIASDFITHETMDKLLIKNISELISNIKKWNLMDINL